ncbi:MAG: NUDIX hydrolase [Candidatus Bathyarchaeota archaeon]|nr:NUDIX hydrolase [Candidatus Bathyarchaeota archaeon]
MKRHYPDHPVAGVGAVILRDDKLLLEKRGNEPAKGQWTIPGGVVELGESLKEAVLRETLEETGLTASNPQLVDVVDQVHLDQKGKIAYHYIIIDYLVHVNPDEPAASSDADELRWVNLNQVETYDLTPSFRRFFTKNKPKLQNASQQHTN